MSSVADLEGDVTAMSPAELEVFTRRLNRERCRQEAIIAAHVHRVSQASAHLADGHRTVKAWGRATCNWSGPEAARMVRLGAMLARFGSAAVLAADGRLGVAQMHALASVVANPRVREQLDASEELLVGQATLLDFDDYVMFLSSGKHSPTKTAHTTHTNVPIRVGGRRL